MGNLFGKYNFDYFPMSIASAKAMIYMPMSIYKNIFYQIMYGAKNFKNNFQQQSVLQDLVMQYLGRYLKMY